MLETYPSVALKFTRLVGFRLRKLRNSYSNLVFKDVKTRLREFLKQWALNEGVAHGNGVVIHNYLTHRDLASLICSTRQTVTQLLNELIEEGVVEYSRKEILIHDMQKLSH